MIGGLDPALLRIILGNILLHGGMSGVRMATPLLALEQGASPATVGVLLGLFAVAQIFLALPAGRYADRHGVRRPLALSTISIATGAALAASFPTLPVLCVSALLTGGGAGVAAVALQRHVGRAAQDLVQLRQVFSWFAIAPAVSNFIGPFLAGLAIDLVGFRFAFALMAVLGALSWIWLGRVRELPAVARTAGHKGGRAWELLKEPVFRRLLLINWLVASCWDIHSFALPVLGHERGFSASVIGTILGAFAIAAAVVRIFLPMVAARVHEWVVLAVATAATAVLFSIYPLLDSPLAMGLMSVALGMVLGTGQPMIMSMLHQVTPQERHGEAIALRLMAIHASSIAMPMLFGLAGTYIGIAGVFWATAVVVGAGTRVSFQLGKHNRLP